MYIIALVVVDDYWISHPLAPRLFILYNMKRSKPEHSGRLVVERRTQCLAGRR